MILKRVGLCLSMAAMLSSTFLCESFMTKAWADTNLIQNSNFDNNAAEPWELKVFTQQDGDDDFNDGSIIPHHFGTYSAEGKIIDGKYNVVISKNGSDRFGIILSHKNITLSSGCLYELCFDVTADEDCKVYSAIGDVGDPYAEYWNNNWWPINLKKGQTIRVHSKFTMNKKPYDEVSQFGFHLGGDCAGKEVPYTVSFDNIYLIQKEFYGQGHDSIPNGYSEVTGDVDGDGKCTIADYDMMQKYISDSDDEYAEGTIFYFNNADMNNDGMVNSKDLQELKGKFTTDGDVNGDGNVNLKDYLLLTRYVINPEDITLANSFAADLNNDGKINQEDIDLLKDMIMK